MSKDVIDMAMACKKSRWELHAEVISHVHRCIYSSVDGKSKESNVHVSSAWRGFGLWAFAIAVAASLEKC